MKIQKHLCLLSILLMAAIIAGLFPVTVKAEETGAHLNLSVTADKTSAYAGENITFIYILSNTGGSTVENITVTDSKLGVIALGASSLAAGENITATAVYMIQDSDLPGLFTSYITATAASATGDGISASASVSINLKEGTADADDNNMPTRAEWLKEKGVPGKGIGHAPGLQKAFNENRFGFNGSSEKNRSRHNNGHGYGYGHGGHGED